MATGTKIHKLIEAGLIKAKHVYDRNEETRKPVTNALTIAL